MEIIKNEDEENDVKVYQYIMDNYMTKCIFLDPGHISDNVYSEYITQIFEILKLQPSEIMAICDDLKNELVLPMYGCVKKYLKLEWYDTGQLIRKNKFTLVNCGEGITIDEYVKEYVFLCITR